MSKFLKETNNVDSEQFFERFMDGATKGHNEKLSKIPVHTDVMKYSIRVEDARKRMNDMMNADSIQKFKVV